MREIVERDGAVPLAALGLTTDTSSGTEADETTERQRGGSPELNFYSFNSQSGQNWIKNAYPPQSRSE